MGLFDIEGRYSITENVQFAAGANNLFSVKPTRQGYLTPDTDGNGKSLTPSNGSTAGGPIAGNYNPNGGFYYARLTLKF